MTEKLSSSSSSSNPSSKSPSSLCALCGIAANKRCARCGVVFYCSKEHQTEDWKVHKQNCQKKPSSSQTSQTSQSSSTFIPQKKLDPKAWAKGLSKEEAAIWFVDCYRLRIDDMYCWGGNITGLYDPDATKLSILSDFLRFCRLAVHRGALPSGWSWSAMLTVAAGLLPFAFEKSDAQQKYGQENVFSGYVGGRSLRFQGELIYGSSTMDPYNFDPKEKKVLEIEQLVDDAFESDSPKKIFDPKKNPKASVFDAVGGAAAWKKLYEMMEAPAHGPNTEGDYYE